MKDLFKRLFHCSGLIAAYLLVPLLYLLEPILRLRFGNLLEDRIGHLASNTELYVRSQRMHGGEYRCNVVFFVWNPANRPLLEMWKRHLTIVESLWLKRAYLACLPVLKKTRFFEPLPIIPVNESPVFLEKTSVLQFTLEEELRGQRALAAMGIAPNDWFVCVHARDPSYLGNRKGFGGANYQPSYLDCSIENYVDAMKWIAAQGGVAVRVGSAVENTLPDYGPRIIDYASLYRDPFMDIYLAARCKFFLGNNSGLITVARIFNVPWASANICPYPWAGKAGWRNMDIPKLLRRKSDGQILTFPEISEAGLLECYRDEPDRLRMLFKSETYESLGYEWIENDPEDILALCMDMYDQVEGRPLDPEGMRLRDAFNRLYVKGYADLNGGGISPRFALRHRDLIEPDAVAPSRASASPSAIVSHT